MKRINHLFSQITSFENLITAFRFAMKGCGKTAAVCRFFYHLESEIIRLQRELIEGTYQPGEYHYFKIYDPKERIIAVAPFRDRVVHHAIVRILTPIYERIFIHYSYATRPGKGTHAAVKRAQKFMRKWPWYLKTDIEKYFNSVDHDILMKILQRKIKDRQLIELLDRIVRNTPASGKGLPIGNLTSQFLANVYLDPLDHEVKDRMGVKGYLRYMDDMIVFGHSKEEVAEIKVRMEQFLLEHLALGLKPKATCINRSTHGLSFLGMRIFPAMIRVKPENRKRSLKRMDRVVGQWRKGEITEERMLQSMVSIIGHLRYFCPMMPISLGAGTV